MLGTACRTGGPKLDLSQAPAPEALLSSLQRQAETRSTLRSLGRVTANTPDGRIRLRTVVLAARPGQFRFETLTPFEQPIDVMTSDGVQLCYVHEGNLYQGPATPRNVALLLPLPMRPSEVVDTLLGGAPVSGRFEPDHLESDEAHWILVLKAPGETGRLWVKPDNLQVTRARLERAGEVITDVRFDRFEDQGDGGPPLATSIEIRFPSSKSEVRLRLTETETGVDLSPALFRIEAPPGTSARAFTELTSRY